MTFVAATTMEMMFKGSGDLRIDIWTLTSPLRLQGPIFIFSNPLMSRSMAFQPIQRHLRHRTWHLHCSQMVRLSQIVSVQSPRRISYVASDSCVPRSPMPTAAGRQLENWLVYFVLRSQARIDGSSSSKTPSIETFW